MYVAKWLLQSSRQIDIQSERYLLLGKEYSPLPSSLPRPMRLRGRDLQHRQAPTSSWILRAGITPYCPYGVQRSSSGNTSRHPAQITVYSLQKFRPYHPSVGRLPYQAPNRDTQPSRPANHPSSLPQGAPSQGQAPNGDIVLPRCTSPLVFTAYHCGRPSDHHLCCQGSDPKHHQIPLVIDHDDPGRSIHLESDAIISPKFREILGDECFSREAFEYYSHGRWRPVPSNCQVPRTPEPATYICIRLVSIDDSQLGPHWATACPDTAILGALSSIPSSPTRLGPSPTPAGSVVLGKRRATSPHHERSPPANIHRIHFG